MEKCSLKHFSLYGCYLDYDLCDYYPWSSFRYLLEGDRLRKWFYMNQTDPTNNVYLHLNYLSTFWLDLLQYIQYVTNTIFKTSIRFCFKETYTTNFEYVQLRLYLR